MGATPSKRKKEKQRRKELKSLTTGHASYHDLNLLRSLSKSRLHRLSAEIDRLSVPPSGFYPNASDSVIIPDLQRSTMSLNRNLVGRPHCNVKGSFSVENLNLDDHPVLTKLQNEQNMRVENMEQRITKIRTSAIQAAERRKFAQMFKAKTDEGRTVQLLKEASEALEALKRQKSSRVFGSEEEDDKGEIIPVKILREERKGQETQTQLQMDPDSLCPVPLRTMNFADPVTWLLLPFLLPIYIIIYLIRTFSGRDSERFKKKN